MLNTNSGNVQFIGAASATFSSLPDLIFEFNQGGALLAVSSAFVVPPTTTISVVSESTGQVVSSIQCLRGSAGHSTSRVMSVANDNAVVIVSADGHITPTPPTLAQPLIPAACRNDAAGLYILVENE